MKAIITTALLLLLLSPSNSNAQEPKPVDGTAKVRNSTLGIVGFIGTPANWLAPHELENHFNTDAIFQTGITLQYKYQMYSNGIDHFHFGAGAGLNEAHYRAPIVRFGLLNQNSVIKYKNGELQLLGGYTRSILQDFWSLSLDYSLSYLYPLAPDGIATKTTHMDYQPYTFLRCVYNHKVTMTGNPDIIHGIAISSILHVHPRVKIFGSYALSSTRTVQYQIYSNNKEYDLYFNGTYDKSEEYLTETATILSKFSTLALGVTFAF